VRENTSLEDGATVALDSIDAIPEPVFVDDTGKRRRRIRLAFYAVGAVSLTYAGLVAVSLLGGPLKPESLLPFPQTFNRPAAGAPSPMTGEAARLAKKSGRGGATPHPSGKPGTANPANAIVVPPTQPAANGTPGPGATPTPEATPSPTPTPTLIPTPSPTPPPPTDPAPTGPNTAPAGGQGGGGPQTGQGGQPQDTNTGTVVPIETTPVAAPNPAPTETTAGTGSQPSGGSSTPAGPESSSASSTQASSQSSGQSSSPASSPASTETTTSNPGPADPTSPAAQL
jgi:hypothetical protein